MHTALIDGKLQITAAVSLLKNSRLIEWNHVAARFQSIPREVFESSWQHDVDPVFGRLICWIVFSAGAEFLVKGVCLVREVDFRKRKQVPRLPSSNIHGWVSGFRKDWTSGGTMTVTNFGTLKDIVGVGENTVPLTRLCEKMNATAKQKDLIFSAYGLLQRTIRNRDAHAYVPNVRDLHYSLVPELFSECFNLLVSWLPNGSATLNTWIADAPSFVASL